tara:strand:- start:1996 stop:3171 length:1176 start_codon:yes stop_codon:yes gene_type:complete
MGPAAKLFLQSLARLVKNTKNIKLKDAYKNAEREFGELTDVMKSKIDDIFKNSKAPSIKKPEKKSADIIPFPKKKEGIMSTKEASPMMKGIEDTVKMLQKNPKRPGGALDPATGLTRTLVRRILDKKGIEIGNKDPLEIFSNTFGDSISDVNNLAEEMLEIDRRGGGMKNMDEMLEADGLFDIEIPTNPSKGFSDDELIDFMRKVEEEEAAERVLKDFDPTDRKPNAQGGMMRNNFAIGSLPKGIQALVKSINKKFGKGAVKTADEIDQPEKTVQQQIMEFETRNKPDAITMESREILDVPEVPKGFSLSKKKLMDKFPEIDEDFANDMMDMDKDTQGRIIKMLENRRLDPEAYDKLLEKYGDTLEFQAEFDKVTRRKNNNQGGLNYLMGM